MHRLAIVTEIWGLARAHRKLWLFPLVLLFVVIGALLVFAQGSVLAPFIYTIF